MNALVRTGVAAIRNVPALLARGRTLAQSIFTSTPTAVAAAGRRLGMAGAPAQKILAAMKDNKLMTALVLLELGTAGADLLSEMAANDAEIAEMIARYGVTNDPVSETAGADLASQLDEMQCITDAANSIGSLAALHNLRRALGLSEEHYKLYDHLRLASRAVRA